jgi:hypothetical protein
MQIDEQLTETSQIHKLTKSERVLAGLFGLFLIALLATASLLTPSTNGFGTHRQLGLPGCTMLTVTGIRCPGCGMTTSWAHTMNGDLMQACSTNLAGTILCGLAIFSSPFLLILSWRGISNRNNWFTWVSITTLVTAFCIAAAEWLIRLASGS